jgi:hypothetical protein
MEHAGSPAVTDARTLITHLQQSVQAVMDGDRILPADGSSLLAMLDRALEGLTDAVAPAVPPLGPGTRAVGGARSEPWAGIETFIGRVQALIEAGVLDAADGRPWIEAAATMGALLPSTDGADSEARSALGETSRG